MVPKLRSADPEGTTTSSQDIREYIYVITALRCIYFL